MSVLSLPATSHTEVYISGDVTIDDTVAIAPGVILQASGEGRIIIKAGACIGMGTIVTANQGTIEIGEGAVLGSGVLMVGYGQIGERACVSSATTIIETSVAEMAFISPGSLLGDTSRQADLESGETQQQQPSARDWLNQTNGSTAQSEATAQSPMGSNVQEPHDGTTAQPPTNNAQSNSHSGSATQSSMGSNFQEPHDGSTAQSLTSNAQSSSHSGSTTQSSMGSNFQEPKYGSTVQSNSHNDSATTNAKAAAQSPNTNSFHQNNGGSTPKQSNIPHPTPHQNQFSGQPPPNTNPNQNGHQTQSLSSSHSDSEASQVNENHQQTNSEQDSTATDNTSSNNTIYGQTHIKRLMVTLFPHKEQFKKPK